ncbi:MAG TPA: TlpA disulfide reductase family protein [Pyrinomonadaceae bacterium]|nr:TlpA disulfide reductase family protein [Pyrinomonadaceae bacterium]
MFKHLRFVHCQILAGLLCLTVLAACSENKSPETPVISQQPNTALPMPPLNGKSLGQMGWEIADGQRSIVSEYKGKVLVLDFYATWCGPCRETIPNLVDLQRRHNNDGLRVIGLNVGGPNDLGQVANFAREFSIQYPLAVPDDDLSLLLLGNDDAIPQTFVFDRNGQLVKRFVGAPPSEVFNRLVEHTLLSQTN